MKYDKEDKYVKIGIVAFATVVAIYIACSLVGYVPVVFFEIIDFLGYAFELMFPVLIAFVIAYLLLIPTKAIEKFLMSRKHFKLKNKMVARTIGVIISYVTVIGIITATVIGIYYMIGGQISKSTTINNIYSTIVSYFDNETISAESLQNQLNKMDLPFSDLISSKLGDIAIFLSNTISTVISFLFGSVISIGGNIFSIFISIILSIYFILSYEYFVEFMNKVYYVIFRESRIGKSIRKSLEIINDTFSAYIRGQLIEAFIVAFLSTIVLYIVDVDYAIVIGIITGICNLIPYIGPLVGTILAGLVALLGGDIFTCIWAIIGMQIVQQLDANVICPRVVGNIVGLPAAFVIIAIIIGGDYGGLIGMLIAVPVAASFKTIVGMWFERHFKGFDSHYEVINQENLSKKREKEEINRQHREQKKSEHRIMREKILRIFRKK